jgi:tRNA threonylcarbamoyladenosine biosynthesis protein TsaB
MKILTIRTDNPQAEIAIFDDETALARHAWQAHYELAETLHAVTRDFLAERQLTMNDIGGLIVYTGPGSFTGLRIGIAVANASAEAYKIPIVGQSGDDWEHQGALRLLHSENDSIVAPFYGSDPHITQAKK